MIKKLALLLLLFGLVGYFIAAVTVLNKPSEGLVCREIEVFVEDSLQTGFIRDVEVLQLLKAQKCDPTGKKMDEVKLAQIEAALRRSPYVEEVKSYKTPGGKVCICIRQRLPVLHIMASDGQSYYLDRSGNQMPKSTYCANLPVVTGNVSLRYARQSLLRLGRFIQDDPFWSNQIQQINVLANGEVEVVPRVGKHVIQLGYPTDVRNKLERMKLFYTEGLNKVGWNKYAQVCLKYDNQIICKKKRK